MLITLLVFTLIVPSVATRAFDPGPSGVHAGLLMPMDATRAARPSTPPAGTTDEPVEATGSQGEERSAEPGRSWLGRIPAIAAACALAGVAVGGCAADPVLTGTVRVAGTTTVLAASTACTDAGPACDAPVVEAVRTDMLEFGVTNQVELSLLTSPELNAMPVHGNDDRWLLPLARASAGRYLVTVMSSGEARQFQLDIR